MTISGFIALVVAIVLALAIYSGLRRWAARRSGFNAGTALFGAGMAIVLVGLCSWAIAATNNQVEYQAEHADAPGSHPASCGVSGAPDCPGSAPNVAAAAPPAPDSQSGSKPDGEDMPPAPTPDDEQPAPSPSDVSEHKVARDHFFAVFEGHGAMPPIILTTEPCRAGHPEEVGKRAIMLMLAGRMEACWADNGGSRPIAICEKQRGDYDGRVMNGSACLDIDKQYFIDPASLPRSAFAG